MKVYKYLPIQYLDSLVNKGEILFRSLSYFRDYEDSIRGDEYEGTKKYRPQNGLQIKIVQTGQIFSLPHSFESSVDQDRIFVFCTSTECNGELAKEFNTNACVEIQVDTLVPKLEFALQTLDEVTSKEILHQNVEYYPETKEPIVDWALPQKIIMSKLDRFSGQKEYRFAFGFDNALKMGCTTHRLVNQNDLKTLIPKTHGVQILRLGSLTDVCQVHYFPFVTK